jgi:hypothetical protein
MTLGVHVNDGAWVSIASPAANSLPTFHSPTMLSVGPSQILRRLFDAAAHGVLAMIAGSLQGVGCDAKVKFDNVVKLDDSESFPVTSKTSESLVFGTAREVLFHAPKERPMLSLRELLFQLRTRHVRRLLRDDLPTCASILFVETSFKQFMHRQHLIDGGFEEKLISVIPTIVDTLRGILNVDLLPQVREGEGPLREHIVVAVEASLKSIMRLAEIMPSLRAAGKKDSWRQAEEKLYSLRDAMSLGSAAAFAFAGALYCRIAFTDSFTPDHEQQLRVLQQQGSEPAKLIVSDDIFLSHVSTCVFKVVDGAEIAERVEYDLVDNTAFTLMDMVNSGLDFFSVSAAALLNDRTLELWAMWRTTSIFQPDPAGGGEGALFVGVSKAKDLVMRSLNPLTVSEALRGRAPLELPGPCLDPLVILSFFENTLRGHLSERVKRLIKHRNSVAHQSHIWQELRTDPDVRWRVEDVEGIFEDLASILGAVAAVAVGDGGQDRLPLVTKHILTNTRMFLTTAAKKFIAMNRRAWAVKGRPDGVKDKRESRQVDRDGLMAFVDSLIGLGQEHADARKVVRAFTSLLKLEDYADPGEVLSALQALERAQAPGGGAVNVTHLHAELRVRGLSISKGGLSVLLSLLLGQGKIHQTWQRSGDRGSARLVKTLQPPPRDLLDSALTRLARTADPDGFISWEDAELECSKTHPEHPFAAVLAASRGLVEESWSGPLSRKHLKLRRKASGGESRAAGGESRSKAPVIDNDDQEEDKGSKWDTEDDFCSSFDWVGELLSIVDEEVSGDFGSETV